MGKTITNSNTVADCTDAEAEREITEHLQEEARTMNTQRERHHSITRPELRYRRPGRPSRTYDVLKWLQLEQLLKQGTPTSKAGATCGLTRRQVRKYVKNFVTRITGIKPIYPSASRHTA